MNQNNDLNDVILFGSSNFDQQAGHNKRQKVWVFVMVVVVFLIALFMIVLVVTNSGESKWEEINNSDDDLNMMTNLYMQFDEENSYEEMNDLVEEYTPNAEISYIEGSYFISSAEEEEDEIICGTKTNIDDDVSLENEPELPPPIGCNTYCKRKNADALMCVMKNYEGGGYILDDDGEESEFSDRVEAINELLRRLE